MKPERWEKVESIFHKALAADESRRGSVIEESCAGDEGLRREVESLLAHHSDSASFIEKPAFTEQGNTDRSPATTAPRPDLKGVTVGHYRIVEEVGAGGMGVVYRARDQRLERDVAIKVFPPGVRIDDVARRRFRKEALALARLNHPNIAAVYDFGEHDGTEYLVMEYVPGQSLAERVRSGPLTAGQALSLAHDGAKALQEAHEQGIVHRDLKPGNIVVTPRGNVKVLDFGLAKLLSPENRTDATVSLSDTMGPVGTPPYMSPEQAQGGMVDERTDLWSLGVVLYECLAGRRPFEGAGNAGVLRSIVEERPKSVREFRPDVPKEVEHIIFRALEKDASKRYQSAAEMEQDLSSALALITAPSLPAGPHELRLSLRYVVPAVLILAISIAAGAWFYHRSERRHWVREQAVPQIVRLQDEHKALEAFLLLQKAEHYVPGDARLAQLAAQNQQTVSIASSPPGATIEIKDYLSPNSAWYRLGTTPLNDVRIPAGYFRWRVSKQGLGEYEAAPVSAPKMNFALDAEMTAPKGMSWVSGGPWENFIGFVGLVGPYDLPPYFIDRDEVTNRQYQQFVDAGGYQTPKYWIKKFVGDKRELSWDEAMALFHDSTGRHGPSTWEGGHYAEGQDDYPVSGISWYEASAYAEFAGKSLPSFSQWFDAAPSDETDYIVQDSNISRSKLAPVGTFQGLGPYGTYDMAGNVREWVENDTGKGTKFILGGAWKSQTYLYYDPQALSPFDRSHENGFRCVRNTAALPPEVLRPIKALERDFSKYKPVPDDVFRAYLTLYAYDNTPLREEDDGVVGETADWRLEKVSYDAAYNNERVTAYLFLPKHVRPPYQTVVFSPSARVLNLHDSRSLGDTKFFDYIIQSGRAVLYPVFYGTYERHQGNTVYVGAAQTLAYFSNRSKDLGRSLDYLGTRQDIDKTKIAYLGVSMGAAEGVIHTTIAQNRLKTAIFLDGGYFLDKPPAGGDQADFAPRLKIPVLMVNGRDDYVFSVEKSQNPFFRMLGTPESEKRHIVLDTPHDVTERRTQLVNAVLDWLDKYLGRVE